MSFDSHPSKGSQLYVADSRHGNEYETMSERVRQQNLAIKDIIVRLARSHKKRTRLARTITAIVKHSNPRKRGLEDSANQKEHLERIQRLSACSRLLTTKSGLSALAHSTPLPELPSPSSEGDTPSSTGTNARNFSRPFSNIQGQILSQSSFLTMA
jgi:hypothetical protein